MSLPITAVGPLNVLTNPILMVSPAAAGCASASIAAPASQYADLIIIPSSFLIMNLTLPTLRGAVCERRVVAELCARSFGDAASTTFGFLMPQATLFALAS
jgi:hypothetical protein